MSFIRKKNEKGVYKVTSAQKTVLAIILLIIISFVVLSAYLEIVNRDLFTADFQISVADPVVMIKNGTQKDSFIEDADYLVVSYNTRFIIDATVTLENIKTLEKYTYHPVSVDGVFSIAGIKSGKYIVTVLTGNDEIYQKTVTLDRSNVLNSEGKDTWDFTAFIMDGFEQKAKECTLSLRDRQRDIEYPVFTIHSNNCNTLFIFASEIDPQNNGALTGTFMLLPGHYSITNAVSNSTMEPFEFDVD
jgi:hypothetical protein